MNKFTLHYKHLLYMRVCRLNWNEYITTACGYKQTYASVQI